MIEQKEKKIIHEYEQQCGDCVGLEVEGDMEGLNGDGKLNLKNCGG